MKKLASVLLGLSLFIGATAPLFAAQDDKKMDDSKKKKKGKKKKSKEGDMDKKG
jgi:hypothetical protein